LLFSLNFAFHAQARRRSRFRLGLVGWGIGWDRGWDLGFCAGVLGFRCMVPGLGPYTACPPRASSPGVRRLGFEGLGCSLLVNAWPAWHLVFARVCALVAWCVSGVCARARVFAYCCRNTAHRTVLCARARACTYMCAYARADMRRERVTWHRHVSESRGTRALEGLPHMYKPYCVRNTGKTRACEACKMCARHHAPGAGAGGSRGNLSAATISAWKMRLYSIICGSSMSSMSSLSSCMCAAATSPSRHAREYMRTNAHLQWQT
jgi:hypothetical protein